MRTVAVIIWRAWYNGSYTMMAKPIRALELLYPMIQFFIVAVAVYYAPPPPPSQDSTTLAALVVVLGLVLKVLYNLKRK